MKSSVISSTARAYLSLNAPEKAMEILTWAHENEKLSRKICYEVLHGARAQELDLPELKALMLQVGFAIPGDPPVETATE